MMLPATHRIGTDRATAHVRAHKHARARGSGGGALSMGTHSNNAKTIARKKGKTEQIKNKQKCTTGASCSKCATTTATIYVNTYVYDMYVCRIEKYR